MRRIRKALIFPILLTLLLAPYQFGYGGNPDEEPDMSGVFILMFLIFAGILLLAWLWDRETWKHGKPSGDDGVRL
jgi:ABC-type uncharacterized transport system permease subunit